MGGVRFGRISPRTAGVQVQMTGRGLTVTDQIEDGAVTTPKLADGAVTVAKTSGIHSQAAADAHAALDLPSAHPAPTGALSMNSQRITNLADPVALTDAVNRAFAEDLIRNATWQEEVLAQQAAPPGAPVAGDRYLVDAAGSGAWLGHDDEIAEYDGAAWTFVVPIEGFCISVIETDELLVHNGTIWTNMGSRIDAVKLGGQVAAYYASQAALDAHAGLDKSTAHPGVLETADIGDGQVTLIKTSGVASAADVAAHFANLTNPHEVTAAQTGAAPAAHAHTVVNGLKPAAGIAAGTLNASSELVLNTGLASITGFPDPIGISPESTAHDFYIVSIAGGSITLKVVNASTGGLPGAVNYNFAWVAFGT